MKHEQTKVDGSHIKNGLKYLPDNDDDMLSIFSTPKTSNLNAVFERDLSFISCSKFTKMHLFCYDT